MKTQPVDELSDTQHDFVIGYMNQNHPEFGRTFVTAFSTIGTEMAQANVGVVVVTPFHRLSGRMYRCGRIPARGM
jgi:hypothetical protein